MVEKIQSVSFIIPVYNEEYSLREVANQIVKECQSINIKEYEIIFIDDGSTDNTESVCKDLIKNNEKINYFKLQKRTGKGEALMKGIQNFKCEVIITLDGDLQDDPRYLKLFLDKISEGYDVVSAWRKNRKDGLYKKLSSYFWNWLLRLIFRLDIHDFNSGYKAYKSEVLNSIDLSKGRYRYVLLFLKMNNNKITEVIVDQKFRRYGESKYSHFKGFPAVCDLLKIFFNSKNHSQKP